MVKSYFDCRKDANIIMDIENEILMRKIIVLIS